MVRKRHQDAGGYYRYFDGKKYHRFGRYALKATAKRTKENLKRSGGHARIVKEGKAYTVFSRGR